MLSLEGSPSRKARGAYFTPAPIADFLARWAIDGNSGARVLDPTCGDGSFVVAAAKVLRSLSAPYETIERHVVGIDIDADSLTAVHAALAAEKMAATTLQADFFEVQPPGTVFSGLEAV